MTFLNFGLKAQTSIDIGASREEVEVASAYIDELKAIYKRVGVSASVVILPNSRVSDYLERSKVSAIALKTAEYKDSHKNVVRIDVPIYKGVNFRLYALRSQIPRIKKLQSPHIITSLGCLGCSQFVDKYKLEVATFQRNLKSCFNVLLKNRTDLALIPDVLLKKEHFKDVTTFDNRVLTTSYYHYIHRSLAHLKPKLEEEFRRSISKGAFSPKKLVKDY